MSLQAPYLEAKFEQLEGMIGAMPSPAPALRPRLEEIYQDLAKQHKHGLDTLTGHFSTTRPDLARISASLDAMLRLQQATPSPNMEPVLDRLGEVLINP